MKILITTDWYAPVVNGVVVSVLLLQRELEKLGHEVRVVTLAPGLRSFRRGPIYYIGSVSAGKIYPGARLRLGRSEALLEQLEAWGPDIVHSNCEFSTFPAACHIAERAGAPLLHTYHTVYENYTHYFSPSRIWVKKVVGQEELWDLLQIGCVCFPQPGGDGGNRGAGGRLLGYPHCPSEYFGLSGMDPGGCWDLEGP